MTTPHGFWGEQETASWSCVNWHFQRLLPTQRTTSPHVSVAWHVPAPVPQDHSPAVRSFQGQPPGTSAPNHTAFFLALPIQAGCPISSAQHSRVAWRERAPQGRTHNKAPLHTPPGQGTSPILQAQGKVVGQSPTTRQWQSQ